MLAWTPILFFISCFVVSNASLANLCRQGDIKKAYSTITRSTRSLLNNQAIWIAARQNENIKSTMRSMGESEDNRQRELLRDFAEIHYALKEHTIGSVDKIPNRVLNNFIEYLKNFHATNSPKLARILHSLREKLLHEWQNHVRSTILSHEQHIKGIAKNIHRNLDRLAESIENNHNRSEFVTSGHRKENEEETNDKTNYPKNPTKGHRPGESKEVDKHSMITKTEPRPTILPEITHTKNNDENKTKASNDGEEAESDTEEPEDSEQPGDEDSREESEDKD